MRFLHVTLQASISVTFLGLGSAGFAADICGETVPANRIIDGIPAYSQCTASTSSAVYSDNGINTSTTSGGTGWVRTQYSGGYQCTELAHRYLYFKWNVQSVPNGNAGTWCDGTPPNGLAKVTTPVHGDLLVLAPGSCGADATTGHVALVDTVAADSLSVMAVQQNSAGRSKYNMTCATCFLHAAANDGTALDGGAPDVGSVSDVAGNVDASKRDTAGTRDGNLPGTGGTIATGGAAGPSGAGGATSTGGATGSSGTSGATGAGGMVASGGSSGTAGASGSGGTAGTGGALAAGGATGAGGAMATGGATSTAATNASNGCSCHLGEGHASQDRISEFAVALLLGMLTLVRRLRRSPGGRGRAGSGSSPPRH